MVVNRESIVDHREKRRKGEPAGRCPDDGFRALVDSSADGMIVLDREGYVQYVNPAAEALFSLPASEMVGCMFGFPIVPDEPVELYVLREFRAFVAAEMRLVEVAWAGEPSYLISFRDLTDRIAAEQVIRRSRDELEAIVGERTRELALINEQLELEIDERKRAEERLHESYRFTSAYLSTLPGIIYRRRNDGDWTMEFLSPGAKKITGYNVTDLSYNSKVSYGQLIHPDDRERVWDEVQEAIRERKPLDTTYRIITARGEEKWVWEQGRSRFKNREIYLEGYIFDITDKKRVEEALERQARLINLSPDAVMVCGLDGTVNFWAQGAENLYGFSQKEALRKNAHSMLHTRFPEPLTDILGKVEATGRWSGELIQLTKDGREVIVDSRWLGQRNDRGELADVLESNVDITERKRIEEELASKSLLLSTVLTSAPVGFAYFDRELRYVLINDWLAEINGFPAGEHIGKRVSDIVPSLAPAIEKVVDQILATGQPVKNHEFYGETAQEPGVMRYWIESWYPVRDSSGEIVGFGAVVEEITERKQAEEALRESEARYRELSESLPLLVWTCRSDGSCDYLSPQWINYTGVPEDAQLGYGWLDQLHPGDRERVAREWASAAERGVIFDIEFRIRRHDGAYHWFKTRAIPLRDNTGKLVKWFGTNSDIDDMKLAEEALRESEERFRNLADNIPNPSWMADADGNFIWYNKQWYDYTGTTPEEMRGWGWQKVHHPGYVESVTEEWKSKLSSGQPFEKVFPLRGRDGKYRWFLTRAVPIKDADGKLVRWLGTNTDITERKQAEEALQDAREQAELYLDIMAHDINNLNQSALLNLELLRLDERMAEEERDMIESTLMSIQGSIGIIENVRKIQRITTGEEHAEPEDLHYLIQQAIREVIRPQSKAVDIRYEGQPGKMVLGIPLLKEAFSNLVNNAVKYSGPSVKIDVAIDEIIEGGKRCYEVSVADNGFGIPGDVKPRLFRRFQRGTTRAHGKGLGLYIVKMLVENTGGSVRLEDRVPGDYRQGSRFVVRLPALEQ